MRGWEDMILGMFLVVLSSLCCFFYLYYSLYFFFTLTPVVITITVFIYVGRKWVLPNGRGEC